MKAVVVYSTRTCPYCLRAKDLLQRRGIPFEERVISWDDEEVWADLEKKSGMKTVPQIFLGDRCLGGYQELAALDASGQLAKIVE